MTRATNFGIAVVSSALIWILTLFRIIPVPFSETFVDYVIPVLPFWCLVSLGSYVLCNIGYNLFTFRECPSEYHSLMEEINESKSFLRSKGLEIQ
ncbi:Dolichol-phosphate mannosyltransferase subunit 3 [Smittium culicis]|uniref:Dolichol-phosphate mannosyltransferase subunit 3 n=2 Tax=Smittium culicis TaxID=133412 RepID=A0A1R1XQS8_9FUNG|nr:Dolichol-phosphate mannosyltransferase subunit 3 [Smittium culicis]OMJ17007.1 Dolichol-phosphate mannosyltransferase subunit 3 [Smittium culicis]